MATLPVALVAVLAVAGGVALAGLAPPPGSASQVRALVAASHRIKVLSANLTPPVATASSDNPELIYPATRYGCASVTQCVFGDVNGTKTIVLFGDSHAEMWLSSVLPWANGHQVKVVVLTTLGCPAASISIWLSPTQGYYTACDANRTKEINLIVGLKPAYVLVAERTVHWKSSPTAYFTNQQWEAGMLTTLSMLKPSGAKLVVVGDVTYMNIPPPQCLATYPTNVQRCANQSPNPRRVNQTHAAAEKAAAASEGAAYINPVPWLCTKTCAPVIGNMVAYWDSFHVSNTYATYLSNAMGAALTSAFK